MTGLDKWRYGENCEWLCKCNKDKCSKCFYRGRASQMICCDYLIITQTPRESSVAECDKFDPREVDNEELKRRKKLYGGFYF